MIGGSAAVGWTWELMSSCGWVTDEFYTDLALFWCFDCVGATIRGFRLGSSLRRCRLGNKGLLNSRSGFAYAMGWRMG